MFIAVFFVFLSAFVSITLAMHIVFKYKIEIENRIEAIRTLDEINVVKIENENFSDRVLKPVYQKLSKFILNMTPGNKILVLIKNLEKAGLMKNNNTESFIFKKTMSITVVSLTFGLLAYLIEPNILKSLIITFITVMAGNIVIRFYIAKLIENRKKIIIKELPYTLDLITVSVEAGLSFDGAMARVIGNIKGELCDEFSKCLKEIRMGIVRKIALKNMSERCSVKELTMLINSIIQADELGVSLGRVLRIESANLREVRKQSAREKAMKAPVKMLFPLIFFIFPSVFLIILGPAALKVYYVLMGS